MIKDYILKSNNSMKNIYDLLENVLIRVLFINSFWDQMILLFLNLIRVVIYYFYLDQYLNKLNQILIFNLIHIWFIQINYHTIKYLIKMLYLILKIFYKIINGKWWKIMKNNMKYFLKSKKKLIKDLLLYLQKILKVGLKNNLNN